MPKFLTQHQISLFERDGFLSPLNILSTEEAMSAKLELEEAERKWPSEFSGSARNNAHLVFTFLDKIVHNEKLLNAIEDLIGENILAYATVLFIKEAHDPGFVSWHQDGKYMGLDQDIGVTAWVALSEANEVSGCMSMIPGSHKEMKEHVDKYEENNILTRGQEVEGVDASKAALVPLQPGQCSLHCPTIIHGSKPNISDSRRIGFAIQTYMPTSVKQTLGRTSAQLVRGIDNYNNFDLLPRPKHNLQPYQVDLRKKVNKKWSRILYAGAKTKRNY